MSAPDISRDEWLALRRQSIGASEAAAACGEDPVVSPLELVCRKRGEVPDADLSNIEAVKWGQILEPEIVAETARRAGLKLLPRDGVEHAFAGDPETELVGFVEGRQPFLRSRALPWQTATIDGFGFDTMTGFLVCIEAKNAGQYHSGAWNTEEGRAPEKYQIQVAHQLAVAPRVSHGILSGLVGGNSLRSIRLERVKIVQVIDAVVAIESNLWECVEKGTMPEHLGPPASVARALKAMHPEDSGETIVLPDDLVETIERFEDAKKKTTEWKDIADELRVKIMAAMGKASYGVIPNGSGSYSLLTIEKAAYEVRAQKYRELRFKKPGTKTTPTKRRQRQ